MDWVQTQVLGRERRGRNTKDMNYFYTRKYILTGDDVMILFPQAAQDSQMNEDGPMLGERGLEAAEKYSTAFLKRSTLSSIRDWKTKTKSIILNREMSNFAAKTSVV